MGQVTPGAEGSGSLSRRVGKIERFLAPFSRQRIQAENELGKPYIYPVLAGTGVPDGRVWKPFSFALDRHKDGASIYYGQLLVAINQTALTVQTASQPTPPEGYTLFVTSNINVEQQEIPNPVVYVPVNLDTEDLFKPTKLDWFGDVFLQWECDENAVMDPESVEIVGPDTPSSIPIPASSSTSPPPMTTCRYFVKIGTVPKEGKIIQRHASDVFWQIMLIRGGGTTFSS